MRGILGSGGFLHVSLPELSLSHVFEQEATPTHSHGALLLPELPKKSQKAPGSVLG